MVRLGVLFPVVLKVYMVIDYERDETDSWYALGFFFPVVLKVETNSWHARRVSSEWF